MLPVFHEIAYHDPFDLFKRLKLEFDNNPALLDSNGYGKEQGYTFHDHERYSYLAIDPITVVRYILDTNELYKDDVLVLDEIDPFACLKSEISHYPKFEHEPQLPPFQGGFIGFLGYEMLHSLEEVAFTNHPPSLEDSLCDMRFCLYDVVVAYDHQLQKAWIVCSVMNDGSMFSFQRLKERIDLVLSGPLGGFALVGQAPFETLFCNMEQQRYNRVIEKTRNYIEEGDIFQANITRCFYNHLPDRPSFVSLQSLYQRLRHYNQAPFAGLFVWRENERLEGHEKGGDRVYGILSSSPEQFLSLSALGHIMTRPIKGTRKRSSDPMTDQTIARELQACEKDRAENLMIVDLMRNDLSKISKPHSVIETALCSLESYKNVHHLVSVIESDLDQGYHPIDVLRATFPGGSITGAPKIRAMEIISELEEMKRGPYCGSLGYIALNGCMNFNILIRTIIVQNQQISFHVGGGIVYDSNAKDEFLETCTKGKALYKVLTNHDELT